MQTTKILLFLTVNCVLVYATESNEQATTNKYSSDVRLFAFSPVHGFIYLTEHSADHPVSIVTSRRTQVATVDYHAPSKTLFFTSPRFGYWTQNAKLYSVPWDPDFVCQRSADESSPSNKRRKIYFTRSFNCSVDMDGHLMVYKDVRREIKELREEENWNPRSLAVDYVGNKLYIVDTAERAVNVFNLDGRNKVAVFHNESLIPFEVAIDPPRGLMFVLAANTEIGSMQIYRANMDGTSSQVLVRDVESLGNFIVRAKLGFAISPLQKRIFFANFDKSMVESVDYEGSGRVTVAKVKSPLTITVSNETLYWSDANTSDSNLFICTSGRCNIWTCRLNDTSGTCLQGSIKLFEEGKELLSPYGLKSVMTHPPSILNPCAIDNGGCQHQCLIKQSNDENKITHGCVCKEGYQLSENLKNCTKFKVTQVYENFYIPNNQRFTSLSDSVNNSIFPISRALLFQLKYEKPHRIVYQSPFRTLEVSYYRKTILEDSQDPKDTLTSSLDFANMLDLLGFDRIEYYTCDTRNEHNSPALRFHENKFAKTLALDWVTKNLYFVKLSNNRNDQAELTVLKFSRPERLCFNNSDELMKYVSKDDLYLAEIPEPIHMVVNPYKGLIYASLRNGSVIRLNADGSNKILLDNINNSVLLAIDLNDDKLYWLDTEQYVNFANLDGTHQKQLFKSLANNTITLRIFGNWLYTKEEIDPYNKNLINIRRYDKLTGKEIGSLNLSNDTELYHESIGIKVSAKDARFVDAEDHPCAVNNGGCESFCFGVPIMDQIEKLQRICM